MVNILIIGLDALAKKILSLIISPEFSIYGFDFDVDKINFYYKNGLILNSPVVVLNDLLKKSNVIILNVEYSKYEIVLRHSPFILDDCLIINTNIYKGNVEQTKKRLKNRQANFIPCNFLLFPKLVIMNYGADAKMNFILRTSNFFRDINVKTAVLNPDENCDIFGKLFQIPYLLEKALLKHNGHPFIFYNIDYANYGTFFEDIVLNRQTILLSLKNFIDNIPDLKNSELMINFLTYNIPGGNKTDKNLKTVLDDDIFLKILIEKIFMQTFVSRNLEHYIDLLDINFDCGNYSLEAIKKYYLENQRTCEILTTMLREKMTNLTSFLGLDDLSVNDFATFLKNV